jgi:LacI family gluconate utilization system Gnt-I transcriptional repressor
MTMAKKTRTKISDVADYLGVHKTTVSRALNNSSGISKSLAQKIKQAARELNYIPNRAAQSLSADSNRTIALLLPSFGNNVFNDVMLGVKAVADKMNYSLMIGDSTYTELGEERIVESYIQQAVSGFILTSTRHTQETRKMLLATGTPVAEIMDISSEPFDINYGVNNELAAKEMTQYLINKGRRNIAFCSLFLDWRALLRKQGWSSALYEAGLSSELCIASRAEPSFQAGAELLSEALHKWPDLDALFFVSDELAAGAVMECNRRGIKPGRDINICGFNDLSFARSIYPSLTTVSVPRRKMAEMATASLIALIEGEEVEKTNTILPFELKIRETA